jgi:uncharacterized protein with PQ loop repeat
MSYIIGWLGSILLALYGAPQAWQSYKQGHSRGINTTLLIMWLAGEVLTLGAILSITPELFLLFNYGVNLVFISIICYYKIYER